MLCYPILPTQTLIDSGVIPVVLDIMSTAEFKTRKEVVWAVCNVISGGTPEQIKLVWLYSRY